MAEGTPNPVPLVQEWVRSKTTDELVALLVRDAGAVIFGDPNLTTVAVMVIKERKASDRQQMMVAAIVDCIQTFRHALYKAEIIGESPQGATQDEV